MSYFIFHTVLNKQ